MKRCLVKDIEFMNRCFYKSIFVGLFFPLLMTGCFRTVPDNVTVPTELSSNFHNNRGRIVVITDWRDNRIAGRYVDSGLRAHAETLQPRGWKNFDKKIAKFLKRNGYKARHYRKPIDLSKYGCDEELVRSPKHVPKLKCKKNIGKAIKAKYELRIVLRHGYGRGGSQGIPKGYPYAECKARIYLNNLRNGERAWEKRLSARVDVDGDINWDNPPHYPDLTLAYYSVNRRCAEKIEEILEVNFGVE